MQSTIKRLTSEHDRLRALADRFEDFLAYDEAPHDAAFTQLGWVLVQELSMHLANERVALRGQPENDVEHRFGLDEAFMQHLAKWGVTSLSSEWRSYVAETRQLLDRLRQRMAFEEATVFPAVRYRRGV